MAANDLVQLVLRLTTNSEFNNEVVWARQISGNSGSGVFELANTSLFTPLTAYDRVYAQLDHRSRYQVTAVESFSPKQCLVLHLAHSNDQETAEALTRDFLQFGSVDAIPERGIVSVSSSDFTHIDPIIETACLLGDISHVTCMREKNEIPDLEGIIDFTLPDPPPQRTIVYFADQDPFWATVGLNSPEILFAVQQLVMAIPRVEEALLAKEHQKVIDFIKKVSHASRNSLPPPKFDL